MDAWILIALLLTAPPATAPSITQLSREEKAAVLHRAAEVRWSEDTYENRLAAIADLEQALVYVPDRYESLILLGRVRDRGNFHSLARASFRRAAQVRPDDPDAYVELAGSFRREWLKYLAPALLDSALDAAERVARLRPYGCEAWLTLVPLRYENGDLDGAADAAERAFRINPNRQDAMAAVALLAFRRGDVEHADSLFAIAVPRMPAGLREFYQDITPLAGPEVGGQLAEASPLERQRAVDQFWQRIDPDPTTSENEARLEYWSRATHAFLLFCDSWHQTLDARAELYARYGPPARASFNPLGEKLSFNPRASGAVTSSTVRSGGRSGSSLEYPLNAVVWEYPQVGMRIVLHDRALNDTYDFAVMRIPDPRTLPKLRGRDDLIATGGGLGLFPTQPPRQRRIDVRGIVARFRGDRGPRVLAQVDAAGIPGDSLWARWVVQDLTGHELSRGGGAFGISSCDPAARRMAELAADLEPGDYRVVASARDRQHRSGLFRTTIHVDPPRSGLALSDLVLTCGAASSFAGAQSIRLDANLDAAIAGDRPLVAYFEVYGLTPNADGDAKFEYEYRVRPIVEASNWVQRTFGFSSPATAVTVTREEIQRGSLRRQFVNVPTGSLKAGRYRLEVHVRDRIAAAGAKAGVEFEKRTLDATGDANATGKATK